MNKFTFHKVGQGLFYTGSICNNRINFVYDCGTETKVKTIRNSIDEYLDTLPKNNTDKPVIDFVVISHLHNDHMKGLSYLLQNANVQKLYLPYLPVQYQDENGNYIYKGVSLFLLAHAVYGEIEEDGDEGKWELESKRETFEMLQKCYNLELEPQLVEEKDFFFINKDVVQIIPNVLTDDSLSFSKYIWEFHMFNKVFPTEKYTDLYNALASKSDLIEKISNAQITEKEIFEIKEIYKKVFKDDKTLNSTSTVLLHRPSEWYREHYSYRLHNSVLYSRMSSLLTGDACFTHEMFQILNGFLADDLIRVLQVPHHGSKHNWNQYIKWAPTAICAISYGVNKHGHPDPEVITDIALQGKLLKTTKNDSFTYYIDNDYCLCCSI